MTKKDFILIAKAIAEADKWLIENFEMATPKIDRSRYTPRVYRGVLLTNLCEAFQLNNSRFNPNKFYEFINKQVEQ